jgi:hypothetical protein
VGKHEFEGLGFGRFKALPFNDPDFGRFPQSFQYIKRCIERTVNRLGIVADAAVPAPVTQLKVENRLGQQIQPFVAGQEGRAEAEPEADMA